MVRWTIGGAMLTALAWMVFFSHEAKGHRKAPTLRQDSSLTVDGDAATTALDSLSTNGKTIGSMKIPQHPVNGTELLVRAYTIPDGRGGVSSQRTFSGTLQARYQSLLGFRVPGILRLVIA
jgi:hypothetical protein